jgi:hypothetical protein
MLQFIADLKAGAKLDAYRMLGELMEIVLGGWEGEAVHIIDACYLFRAKKTF